MAVSYRPYKDSDAEAVLAIRNHVHPDLVEPLEEWRRTDAEFDAAKHPRRRWVAVDAGEVIGYACAWNTAAPRKYRAEVMVRPDRQRQGVGGALLEQMLREVRALGGISLQARARDDQPEILAFLERRDFRETHRMVSLSLALAGVDIGALEPWVALVTARGIAIATLAEEQMRRSDCLRALWEAHNAALPGWPDPDPDPVSAPPAPWSYERFLRSLEEPRPISELFFIACRGEEYLGYSSLSLRAAEPGVLLAGTAVRAEERGHGIATALKARTVQYARRHGYRVIRTSTANPAMRRVNEKFGFRPGRAEVRLVRRLAEA
jgi:GNAT superfamily N-acetyltransferase